MTKKPGSEQAVFFGPGEEKHQGSAGLICAQKPSNFEEGSHRRGVVIGAVEYRRSLHALAVDVGTQHDNLICNGRVCTGKHRADISGSEVLRRFP